jgi:arsenite-transporting ATPase
MTSSPTTSAGTPARPGVPAFLIGAPRFVFFTGKGGVGKTSLACAAAVRLAGTGARVLLVSTDPASNVGQVFGLSIGNTVTPIRTVPGLSAIEIDPGQAAAAYREKIIGPVRDLLPAAEIAAITEQLSGSCTTEIASFNEFTGFLADDTVTAGFDHVVFDTAPTGHTIRLLQLPGEWTSFLDAGKGDSSCLGPMAGLDRARATYAAALARLADPVNTRMVLVARPCAPALSEATRTAGELAAIGITSQYLVVNAVLPPADPADAPDELADVIRGREAAALGSMSAAVAGLPRDVVPLHAGTMVGVDALRALLPDLRTGAVDPAPAPTLITSAAAAAAQSLPGLDRLVEELARADHGLVMVMGKGGVGKTTIAAALALALAARGHDVHLATTDPAGHLTDTLPAEVPGVTVSRIDPTLATAAYRAKVMAARGASLDEAGRARLAEDLLSPCTEEVAVFQQFSHLVHQARHQFVVIDTAPTGHTLLLMDAAGSYHRDVLRTMGPATHATTPLMRLRDPDLTRVVIVTLPDATPVLEAADLQADLERAGIHPWAWVINASLAAAEPTSALLTARAAAEAPYLERVRGLATRIAVVPLRAAEPVGLAALTALVTQPA